MDYIKAPLIAAVFAIQSVSLASADNVCQGPNTEACQACQRRCDDVRRCKETKNERGELPGWPACSEMIAKCKIECTTNPGYIEKFWGK